jgi:hypothetical protein
LDIESIGKVAFDQFKIYQREFFELIDSVESDECGHDVFTMC